MSSEGRASSRLERRSAPSLRNWEKPGENAHEAVVDCGWGRLIFAHTFSDNKRLAAVLADERADARDIAFYLRDPHVVLAQAPQSLFLDPSHTYRLWLGNWRPGRVSQRTTIIRKLRSKADAEAINRLYASRQMVLVPPEFVWDNRKSKSISYIVAEDAQSGEIIGTVTGVDHTGAFEDPENGSSLWCLAVDPRATQPGIGRALVAYLADHFLARGRSFMDLSVLHDNMPAIALYERMGFQRVPVFTLKTKNPINEKLYTAPAPASDLNAYARIIVDEARRRGIAVDVHDAAEGYFSLGFGGRSIMCRESLTELTSAIAMSRCDNKMVTSHVMRSAGLYTPEHVRAGDEQAERAFLKLHRKVVVKPVRGEQGHGISVGISSYRDLQRAIREAQRTGVDVMIEQMVEGEDLRVVVIDFQVVAAAVRRPPEILCDGEHTVAELIEKHSRRRAAATAGESRIPIDGETRRVLRAQDCRLEDVPERGRTLHVRKTANLHTGGTLHDVTDQLSPVLHDAAVEAARALDIPVVGLDMIVDSPSGNSYCIIEANERPGLANHEPQPTAQRFIDLLFPQTVTSEHRRGRSRT
ncbi:MAG: N-acetylglutaminylglutamine synthetase [Xanthomonadaceae bacterium]|nr:N-acetylglutaminylglutamine synthetase [Xanthomonadaceae bacterium]